MSGPYTKLDANQVLKHAFDEAEDRLRVDAVVSASIGDVSIVDSSTGDPAKVNADGSLDVNVVNPLEIAIDASTDSIAIKDGANQLAVNADGSINVAGSIEGTVSTNINGLANFQTSVYPVGTSVVQLTPTPLSNRSSVSFKAICTTGSAMIFIGNSNSVTSSTGYPLFSGDSLQLDLTGAQAAWAIASAPGQTLYVLEIG